MILTVTLTELLIVIFIIAISTVGTVNFLKNFIHGTVDPKQTAKKKISNARRYAVASFMIVCFLSFINSGLFVGAAVCLFVDLIFLGLAFTQLAWDVFAKALPDFVQSIFNKQTGSVNIKPNTTLSEYEK